VWATEKLNEILSYSERCGPDDESEGECPECGALTYPLGLDHPDHPAWKDWSDPVWEEIRVSVVRV
jgi:hypothetical protein